MTTRAKTRWAVFICLALAAIVWNRVFDRMVIEAGRAYSRAAVASVESGAGYLRIDDWMRPAIAHAARTASMWAVGVVVLGLATVFLVKQWTLSRARSGSVRRA